MAKKKIGLQIDLELHSRVKGAAALRGTNLEGAYEEALRAWLGEKQSEPPISREQSRYINALLWLFDNPSGVLDAIKTLLASSIDKKREHSKATSISEARR